MTFCTRWRGRRAQKERVDGHQPLIQPSKKKTGDESTSRTQLPMSDRDNPPTIPFPPPCRQVSTDGAPAHHHLPARPPRKSRLAGLAIRRGNKYEQAAKHRISDLKCRDARGIG